MMIFDLKIVRIDRNRKNERLFKGSGVRAQFRGVRAAFKGFRAAFSEAPFRGVRAAFRGVRAPFRGSAGSGSGTQRPHGAKTSP